MNFVTKERKILSSEKRPLFITILKNTHRINQLSGDINKHGEILCRVTLIGQNDQEFNLNQIQNYKIEQTITWPGLTLEYMIYYHLALYNNVLDYTEYHIAVCFVPFAIIQEYGFTHKTLTYLDGWNPFMKSDKQICLRIHKQFAFTAKVLLRYKDHYNTFIKKTKIIYKALVEGIISSYTLNDFSNVSYLIPFHFL